MARQFSIWAIFGSVLCATAFIRAEPAHAEANEVRFSQQFGLSYLGFAVMQHDKLVEQHLSKRGLGSVAVSWRTLGNPAAMMDAVLSGEMDFIAPGAPTLVTMWDKTTGTPNEIRALSSLNNMPQILLSRDPAVQTIKDLKDTDRLALPAVKVTSQAIILEIAAAKIWGQDNYAKLDHLTVSLAHPEAVAAMLGGKSEITGHFTIAPFYQMLLKTPPIHKILHSFEVMGGKHTNGMLLTSKRFYEANPGISAAVYDAVGEANNFIKARPREAAAIYVTANKDKFVTAADIEAMLKDPEIEFTREPAKLLEIVKFMHDVGRIKNVPASWKDMFHPIAHGLNGS